MELEFKIRPIYIYAQAHKMRQHFTHRTQTYHKLRCSVRGRICVLFVVLRFGANLYDHHFGIFVIFLGFLQFIKSWRFMYSTLEMRNGIVYVFKHQHKNMLPIPGVHLSQVLDHNVALVVTPELPSLLQRF